MSVFTAKNKAFDAQNCVFGGRFLHFGALFAVSDSGKWFFIV